MYSFLSRRTGAWVGGAFHGRLGSVAGKTGAAVGTAGDCWEGMGSIAGVIASCEDLRAWMWVDMGISSQRLKMRWEVGGEGGGERRGKHLYLAATGLNSWRG